jgi:hypothetical protein
MLTVNRGENKIGAYKAQGVTSIIFIIAMVINIFPSLESVYENRRKLLEEEMDGSQLA